MIVPVHYGTHITVACSSTARGSVTLRGCDIGCIGCFKCQKTCPKGAITVTSNLARVDYSLCDGCGQCVEVWPPWSHLQLPPHTSGCRPRLAAVQPGILNSSNQTSKQPGSPLVPWLLLVYFTRSLESSARHSCMNVPRLASSIKTSYNNASGRR
ncbi:MAG: 4Fe-4S dicluster domain-containing protein [Oscillospiraceae bacterium]